jgi:hypothetical protein
MSEKQEKGMQDRLQTYADHIAGKASVLSEKEYQHFIMRYLEQQNGYFIRDANSTTVCTRLTVNCCSSS